MLPFHKADRFSRKGLDHLGLQGLLQWTWLLIAPLRPWQLLSSSTGHYGGNHLQPLLLMTSWTPLCDLLLVAAAEEAFVGRKTILHLLSK